jgi:hemoglobin/transferrin/lactoferrin receptor protein
MQSSDGAALPAHGGWFGTNARCRRAAAVAAVATLAGLGMDPTGASEQLDRVEVIGVANRFERAIDQTAGSVSVISREEMERELAANLRDVLRYEPGVTVESSAGRFGLGDIGIRGIGGNRVLMQVDGIPLPESYRVGRFSNASRNQFDLALLRRIEILRGPASALYGSDALGGVVALATVDPADFLAGGSVAGGEVGGGYASVRDGWTGSAVVAGEQAAVQGLIGYQRSEGHEMANQGTVDAIGRTRTVPDPQTATNDSLLGKLVYSGRARWRFTLERNAQQTQTDVLSLNPLSSRTVSLSGDDRSTRNRASVDFDAAAVGVFSAVRGLVYTQRALTVNETTDVRARTTAACLSAAGSVACRRDVQFRFEQNETGASLLARAEGGGSWLFGIEGSYTSYEEGRDGTQTNLNTGEVSNVVGGEPMPTRDFPLTTRGRISAFAQNELRLAGDRLDLVSAVRFDSYVTRAEADPAFAAANPGRPVVGSGESIISPKLGLLYRVSPTLTLAGLLGTGFRAPPAADLNLGLSSLPAGYAVVPNPGLRPERSKGGEASLRGRLPGFRYTVTAFSTDYDDLIVSRAPLACPEDPACVPGATATFQSQNIESARIYGLEAEAQYEFDSRWSIRAALVATRGTDTVRGRPLNTIEPARAVAGLLYDDGRVSAALHVTHTTEKTRIDRSAGDIFAPPASTVVDATASWRWGESVRVTVGVFNVFDQTYWHWSDVRNVIGPGATIDRYSQAGRNASVLLRAAF